MYLVQRFTQLSLTVSMRHRPVHNGERQTQTSLQDEEPLVHSIILTRPLLGSSPRGCITGVGVTAALADPVTLARLAILVNEVNQLSLLSGREREREIEDAFQGFSNKALL